MVVLVQSVLYIVEWKELSSRLLWVRGKVRRECWVFVPTYGPGCVKNEDKIQQF